MGDPERPGTPVASWLTPRAGSTPAPPALIGDDFAAERLHAAWHTRGTSPEHLVLQTGGGRLTLAAHPDGALLQPLNGSLQSIEVSVLATSDAAASFVVSDASTRELTISADASGRTRAEIITHTASNTDALLITEDLPPESRIGVRLKGDHMHFTLNGNEVGTPSPLTGRRWTGAEWGLAARGTGTATFGAVEVTA